MAGWFGRISALWRTRDKSEGTSRLLLSGRTQAGVYVTPDNAMQNAAVWGCVTYLSRTVAQLPWRVMREVAAGGSEISRAHPVDYLLSQRPCPDMGSFTWRQTILGHALLWGNGYAEIERDARGVPVALWPIHPSRVTVKRGTDNELYYEVTNSDGILGAMDVFHVRGFGDGMVGFGVIEYAAQSIGWARATELFGASYFGEGMNPTGIIEVAKGLTAPAMEVLRQQFKKLYSGPKGEKTAILDAGMKFTKISSSPEESQFIDVRQHQVEEICFVAGTDVLTPWGPKPIETIEAGERVLTHRGRWRRVTNVMARHYVGKVVTVAAKGQEPVTATANHPFYALNLKPNRSHRTTIVGDASWVAAEDLVAGGRNASGNRNRLAYHAVTQPKLKHDVSITGIDLAEWAGPFALIDDLTVRASENGRATACARRITADYEFGWLCGLFAADGSTSEKQTIFYLGAHETELTQTLESRLARVLGVTPATTITEGNVARTVVSHRVVSAMFSDFGHTAHGKALPGWCMAAGSDFQRGLIDGLVDGDGCEYHGRTLLRTTSRALAWQTRVLLWARGIHGSMFSAAEGEWVINGRSGKSREIHTVEWRGAIERFGSAVDSGDVLGFRIDETKHSTFSGLVYNLEVEEDESYTTVGGCVHNCRWFGIPPHKIQHLLRTTFSNIENQAIEVVVDTIIPWVKIFEEEANYKLFGANRPGFFTKMNLNGLLRGDSASRAAFYKSMRELGVMSVNEIRGLEDMNPIGPEGDKRIVQMNMTTLERIGEEPHAPEPVAPMEPVDPPDPQSRVRVH